MGSDRYTIRYYYVMQIKAVHSQTADQGWDQDNNLQDHDTTSQDLHQDGENAVLKWDSLEMYHH